MRLGSHTLVIVLEQKRPLCRRNIVCTSLWLDGVVNLFLSPCDCHFGEKKTQFSWPGKCRCACWGRSTGVEEKKNCTSGPTGASEKKGWQIFQPLEVRRELQRPKTG